MRYAGRDQYVTNTRLTVGVYQGPEIPQSFRVYAENVQRHLPDFGISVIPFTSRNDMPKSVDVLWDIRSGGGNPPANFLLANNLPPLVVTVHGFAPVALNGWEYFGTLKGAAMSGWYARQKRILWQKARASVAGIIAVSAYVKGEAAQFTNVPAEKIHVCHHGVDNLTFTPCHEPATKPYFFHISNNEPRKNIRRIVAAFRQLRRDHDIELLLKLPEQSGGHYRGIEGVRVLTSMLGTEEVAELYRHAVAFIFPSLYEGFGMPIIEAMSSGCPVITSDASACAEVAGNAALLVEPRDKMALLQAMRSLCENPQVRAERVTAGLQRAQHFSWNKSAGCHAHALRVAGRNAGSENES